jgi:hypothetical protein
MASCSIQQVVVGGSAQPDFGRLQDTPSTREVMQIYKQCIEQQLALVTTGWEQGGTTCDLSDAVELGNNVRGRIEEVIAHLLAGGDGSAEITTELGHCMAEFARASSVAAEAVERQELASSMECFTAVCAALDTTELRSAPQAVRQTFVGALVAKLWAGLKTLGRATGAVFEAIGQFLRNLWNRLRGQTG